MRPPVLAGLAFIVWISALGVLLVQGGGLDLYIVLALIGLLVLRELLSTYATRALAARMAVFIFVGLLAFVYIVVERVRDILNL